MGWLLRLLLALGALGLAAFLLIRSQDGFQFDRRLGLAILLAQPFLLLAQTVLAWRFRHVVSRPEAGFVRCLEASLLGQATDVILPWRLSEIVRLVRLNQDAGVPLPAGFAAAFIERVADLVALAALLLAATLTMVQASATTFIVVAVAALAGLLALPTLAPLLDRVIAVLPVAGLRQFASTTLAELVGRLRDGTFWRIMAPTVLIWAAGLVATWAFFAVLDLKPDTGPAPSPLTLAIAVFAFTTVGAAVALLPASLGTYEAAVVLALGSFGIPFQAAVPVGIGLHIAHLALGFLGGAYVAVADWPRLKRMVIDVRHAILRRS